MTGREFTYPSIRAIRESGLLVGLEQRDAIFAEITDPNRSDKLLPELEHQIFEGAQELIDLFNGLDADNPVLSMPSLSRTKALKDKISKLPNLEGLTDKWQVAMALVNGSKRMLDGQTNKVDLATGKVVTQDAKDKAIGTPSMPIPPKTKAVGTALHFIERAMFVHFRNKSKSSNNPELNKWFKDEILFALEDMAQLRHSQLTLNKTTDQETILFELINTPNDLGGLGWRKQANLDAMLSELSNL